MIVNQSTGLDWCSGSHRDLEKNKMICRKPGQLVGSIETKSCFLLLLGTLGKPVPDDLEGLDAL